MGRAPRGARGLKFSILVMSLFVTRRAPRGARGLKSPFSLMSRRPGIGRAPRGARGLKSAPNPVPSGGDSRAPRGARGLKLFHLALVMFLIKSCPSRGTWIEIPIRLPFPEMMVSRSCPSRGTWIEIISSRRCSTVLRHVVPLAGHVD